MQQRPVIEHEKGKNSPALSAPLHSVVVVVVRCAVFVAHLRQRDMARARGAGRVFFRVTATFQARQVWNSKLVRFWQALTGVVFPSKRFACPSGVFLAAGVTGGWGRPRHRAKRRAARGRARVAGDGETQQGQSDGRETPNIDASCAQRRNT